MGAWEVEAEQRITLFQTHIFGVVADWRIDPFVAVGQVYGRRRRPGRTCASRPAPGLRMWIHPDILGRVDWRTEARGVRAYVVLGYPVLMRRSADAPLEDPRSSLAGAGAALGLALLIASPSTRAAARSSRSLAGGGWPLLAASLYRIVPLALNAAAWRALLAGRRLPAGRPCCGCAGSARR